MASKFIANINQKECVACGVCANVCPRKTITVVRGLYADVNAENCVGCRKCMNMCPASVISMVERGSYHE